MNTKKILPFALFAASNLLLAAMDIYELALAPSYAFFLLNSVFGLALAAFLLRGGSLTVNQNKQQGLDGEAAEEENAVNLEVLRLLPNFLCLKNEKGQWMQASDSYLTLFNLQGVDYKGKTNPQLCQYVGADVKALTVADSYDAQSWRSMRSLKEALVIDGKSLDVIRKPIADEKLKKSRLLITADVIRPDPADGEGAVKFNPKSQLPAKDRLSMAYCDSHFGWAMLDGQLTIVDSNDLFSSLFGYDTQDLIGMPIASLVVNELAFDPSLAFNFGNRLWSKEVVCKHKQEKLHRSVALNISQLDLTNGVPGFFVSAFDITRQKQAESKILRIAHYDDLTGLVNRVMFTGRLARLMAKTTEKRPLHNVVVFFIDLDRFKAVNDSLGHDAGDELLKKTAQRLESVVRKNDTVARLSGDEFAVMMVDNGSHEHALYGASMIAEKIIQALSEPFYIHRGEVFIGASIGIAVYPEDANNPEELLKLADVSMYQAKKQGRNNYQFYNKSFAVAWRDRLVVEKDLRKAIEKKELELFYQPQYNPDGSGICGAEVLVRWFKKSSAVQKMIPPDQFIGVAEETGLIVEMGKWILEKACQQLKSWQNRGLSLSKIAVNVSPRQFADNQFLHTVEAALLNTGLDSSYLELELTESMLIGDIKQIELQLIRLKKMGVTLALDDFGTGYSSLSYLRNFPIDVVKVDKSFIKNTPSDSKNARIVSAIIRMGHSLGQKVVAEGVETEEQLKFLKTLGCDVIQGYVFSRPLPMVKMTELLEKTHGTKSTGNQRLE